MIDSQSVQSQRLKCSDYRIGQGFLSQEWRRSAGKRFITRFEMLFPTNAFTFLDFRATVDDQGRTKSERLCELRVMTTWATVQRE